MSTATTIRLRTGRATLAALLALLTPLTMVVMALGVGCVAQDIRREDPAASTSSSEREAALERIEAALVASPIKNAVVLMGRDQEAPVVITKGDGDKDRLYFADSGQKWVVATVLLRELRRLGLSPETPLADIPGAPAWARAGELGERQARHFLSFTSGMPAPPLCATLASGPLQDCAEKITAKGASSPAYRYGTYHSIALLAALEASGGETWAEVFARFQAETNLFPNASYGGTEKPLKLSTSAVDYAAFLRAILASSLLGPEDEAEMFKNHVGTLPIENSPAEGQDLEGIWRYGFGNWVRCDDVDDPGRCASLRHSAGARGFYPWLDLEKRTYGVVAHNARVGDWIESHRLMESVSADVAVVTGAR